MRGNLEHQQMLQLGCKKEPEGLTGIEIAAKWERFETRKLYTEGKIDDVTVH